MVPLYGEVSDAKALLLVVSPECLAHLAEQLLSTKVRHAICGVPDSVIRRGPLVAGASMMGHAIPLGAPRTRPRPTVSARRKFELHWFLHTGSVRRGSDMRCRLESA